MKAIWQICLNKLKQSEANKGTNEKMSKENWFVKPIALFVRRHLAIDSLKLPEGR